MSDYFEPGIRLGDEDLLHCVRRRLWTMTEAFFLLQGQKPPGVEYSEGLRAWYASAYSDAVDAFLAGELGQQKTLAGERIVFAPPADWLAWANSLEGRGIKDIVIDGRVRELLCANEPRTEAQSGGIKPSMAKSPKASSGPGRKPGSGSFKNHDEKLFPEITRLIVDGKATSSSGAALLLAKQKDKVKGPGTPESKAKRLAKRYRIEFG